jgi:outer membrane protein TolC
LKQAELVKNDIRLGIQRTTAQVNNGAALRSSQQLLEAELLEDDQRTISLQADRKGLLAVLSLFINKALPDSVKLQRPVIIAALNGTNNRPEMKLFSYQDSLLGSQRDLVNAGLRPRFNIFGQGGYGKPGLNLLKNSFDFFYIAGLRFNWTLGNFYTSKKEKQLLTVGQQMSDVQRDAFVLNTNTQLKQEEEEIKKLMLLIASDQQIIDVRAKVKQSANAQLENGVITSTDFLLQVNAEDQARRSQITHELQLLQAQINYQTIAGNQ